MRTARISRRIIGVGVLAALLVLATLAVSALAGDDAVLEELKKRERAVLAAMKDEAYGEAGRLAGEIPALYEQMSTAEQKAVLLETMRRIVKRAKYPSMLKPMFQAAAGIHDPEAVYRMARPFVLDEKAGEKVDFSGAARALLESAPAEKALPHLGELLADGPRGREQKIAHDLLSKHVATHPEGVFKALRATVSSKDFERRSDLEQLMPLLERALSTMPPDAALPHLKTLLSEAGLSIVRSAAARQLGAYGDSPARVDALTHLLTRLKAMSTHRKHPLAAAYWGRWADEAGAVLGAAQRLTGQSSRQIRAWVAKYDETPRNLAPLFEGAPLPAVPGAGESPWRRARARLAKIPKKLKPAVDAATTWLVAHQSENGSWSARESLSWCNGKRQSKALTEQQGYWIYDVGVTGLAVQALVQAGHTGAGSHANDKAVKRALRWLISVQDEEGCFGKRVKSELVQYEGPWGRRAGQPGSIKNRSSYVYNHAAATLAMVEAYAMSGDEVLREPVQRALDLILAMRNPYFGWRYGNQPGESDTSVTIWMAHALGTARLINATHHKELEPAPFIVPETWVGGCLNWFYFMTDGDDGHVGYMWEGKSSSRLGAAWNEFAPSATAGLTAGAGFARMLLGDNPKKNRVIENMTNICLASPPKWSRADGTLDMLYWYFGSLALHQVKGTPSSRWLKQAQQVLIENQVMESAVCARKGSWDPIGAWGAVGGRVYATSVAVLTLLAPGRVPLWRR